MISSASVNASHEGAGTCQWGEVVLSCNAEETTAQMDTRCEEGPSVYQIDTLAYVSWYGRCMYSVR